MIDAKESYRMFYEPVLFLYLVHFILVREHIKSMTRFCSRGISYMNSKKET